LRAIEALEAKLDVLASAVRVDEESEKATKRVHELRALLYGGPFEPSQVPLPHKDYPEFHPILHTWEGLYGLVRQAEKYGGDLLIVDNPCSATEVKRSLELKDTPESDRAAEVLAKLILSLQTNKQLVCFAPAICDRLDQTAVELRDDGMLTALALVVERFLPKEIPERHVTAPAILSSDDGFDALSLTRCPAVLDFATLSPIEAITVDGEPFASKTTLARYRRVQAKRGAGWELLPTLAGPRSLGGEVIGDVVIQALANLPLTGDERNPLRSDVHRVALLAFALSGPTSIPEDAGARFIAGRDTHANRQRWWRVVEVGRALVVTVNEQTGAWRDLLNATADGPLEVGGGVVHLSAPAWWRGAGKGSAWRLSGGLWRPPVMDRNPPEQGTATGYWGTLNRTLAGFEARLWWSPSAGRGRTGRIPDTLRPARKGGPGQQVWVPWFDVLTLSGEHVPWPPKPQSAAARRWLARRDALVKAEYLTPPSGAPAPAGDTVEIVKVVDGRGRNTAGLWIRASARFVEAVRLAQKTRNWQQLPAETLLGERPSD